MFQPSSMDKLKILMMASPEIGGCQLRRWSFSSISFIFQSNNCSCFCTSEPLPSFFEVISAFAQFLVNHRYLLRHQKINLRTAESVT